MYIYVRNLVTFALVKKTGPAEALLRVVFRAQVPHAPRVDLDVVRVETSGCQCFTQWRVAPYQLVHHGVLRSAHRCLSVRKHFRFTLTRLGTCRCFNFNRDHVDERFVGGHAHACASCLARQRRIARCLQFLFGRF
jgi:hypothetical protein